MDGICDICGKKYPWVTAFNGESCRCVPQETRTTPTAEPPNFIAPSFDKMIDRLRKHCAEQD